MNRRRKLTLIILATAGALLLAAGTATATAVILRDQPEAEPAALRPTASPTPTRTAPTLPDYGRQACQELFAGDVLDIGAVTDAMERDDPEAVNQWVQDLYDAARRAVTAEQAPVRNAAGDVRAIIEDGNGGPLGELVADLTRLPEPPVLAFALACTEADLVSQQQIDRWRDTINSWEG